MQNELETAIKSFPEVERVFAKMGTAEIATDPMPPSVADNFIMLKPRADWPDPSRTREDLLAAMQKRVVRSLYTIPAAVAEVADPEAKRFTILRLALADPWVGMTITANPGTLLQLAEFANSRAEHLIRDIRDGGISGDSK